MTDTSLPAPPASPVAVLGAAREAVRELCDVLWAARSGSELLEVSREVERLRSALDVLQLRVVAEIEASNAAAGEGWAWARDFVTAVTGGHQGEGRRVLALSRAVSSDRVATGEALVGGLISRAQAEVVIAAVDRLPVRPELRAAAERLLLEEARTRDATDLRKVARQVLERLDPDGSERRDERALARDERAAHAGRFLSMTEDGIGGVRLTGRGTVEDAAHLKAVLFPLAAPEPPVEPGWCGGTPGTARSCGVVDCAHDGRDPREHGTRMWDALVEAARLLAGTQMLPTSHGTRPRVGVTIALDQLRDAVQGEAATTGGLLDTGGELSASAVRRLACDAEILPLVLGSRSQILDVGRTSRLVTLGLWLALLARDQRCAFPGCTRPPIACGAHHIEHWADGGTTALNNLVLLCRRHHTMLHTTAWEVRLHPHDQRPEFLPPARLDPERRPRRRQPLRQ